MGYWELARERKRYIRGEGLRTPEYWGIRALCSKKYQLEPAIRWGEIQETVTTVVVTGRPLHGAHPSGPRGIKTNRQK